MRAVVECEWPELAHKLPPKSLCYGGTELIFPRRRWATRIIEKAGFPIRSREATVLIDLLIWASKRNQQGLPIAEQVLIPALRMVYNQSAIVKVAEELAVSSIAAENALDKLPQAAIAVAAEHGLNEFVELATRQGPPKSN